MELGNASLFFNADRLKLLRAYGVTKKCFRLSENPTLKELLWAIAAMGGHIKNNGHPGWIVLGRGYDKFLNVELGWLLAKA
jgi:hypothetical protein